MRLAIFGAGGLGREVLVLARQINMSGRWREIFFIDDQTEQRQKNGIQVSRSHEVDYTEVELVIAVGEPADRECIANQFAEKCPLATLVHPQVYLPEDTVIGPGCVICSGVFISCNVTLGTNTVIQPQSCIAHDGRIGAHGVLASHVSLAGNCCMGDRVFMGMNSVVKENIRVGNDVIIGMGAAVFNDIPSDVIVRGNPGHITGHNIKRKVFHSAPTGSPSIR